MRRPTRCNPRAPSPTGARSGKAPTCARAPARHARPRAAALPPVVMLASSLLCFLPRRIRVVGGHRLDLRVGVGAKVLLVDDPILVDDEGHDSCRIVLRRP